jgi:hypothetical protein
MGTVCAGADCGVAVCAAFIAAKAGGEVPGSRGSPDAAGPLLARTTVSPLPFSAAVGVPIGRLEGTAARGDSRARGAAQ